ncbi:hypothetical protein [Corynebacterium sp. HMSC14H10]|uniref:hypothetical protein n=1 Tax=Corynebacterium TaxID=1716 RepID=UPI0008A50FFD|nr:hypothetical protein [Corynebacterium sp. HMSC14H10]OFU62918.1 hypothetical protein HMPREF3135_02210 [Corynebacterium sp. HMSC14H10]
MTTQTDAQMKSPISGVRIYRYDTRDDLRVAMHLPHGANVIDISIEEAQRVAEDLTQLVP